MMGQAAPPLLAATFVVLLATSTVVALRWHLILSAEAPSPGAAALLKIVLVGMFFNQVLPTGVGGDAVRVWRCCRRGIGLGVAVRSILLDRACGYLVLVLIYAANLPGFLRNLSDPRQKVAVVAVLAAGLRTKYAKHHGDLQPGAPALTGRAQQRMGATEAAIDPQLRQARFGQPTLLPAPAYSSLQARLFATEF